jgi:hypothetical protein
MFTRLLLWSIIKSITGCPKYHLLEKKQSEEMEQKGGRYNDGHHMECKGACRTEGKDSTSGRGIGADFQRLDSGHGARIRAKQGTGDVAGDRVGHP